MSPPPHPVLWTGRRPATKSEAAVAEEGRRAERHALVLWRLQNFALFERRGDSTLSARENVGGWGKGVVVSINFLPTQSAY